MISSSMTDMVDKATILSSFWSDHSCAELKFSPLPNQTKETGYWKFIASLTNDTEYVNQLNQLLDILRQTTVLPLCRPTN